MTKFIRVTAEFFTDLAAYKKGVLLLLLVVVVVVFLLIIMIKIIHAYYLVTLGAAVWCAAELCCLKSTIQHVVNPILRVIHSPDQ